jgi:phage shock protein C
MNRQNEPRRGPYRSRDGIILGVCKGLADYMDVSTFAVRLAAVVGFLFTGFWPLVVVYLVLAVVMQPEPAVPFRGRGEEEFYNSYTRGRRAALERLKASSDRLKRRLARLEHVVTTSEYDFNRRLRDEHR